MPFSWLFPTWCRLAARVLGLASVMLAALPSLALAAPPVLMTTGHASGHLTASWSLPPGVEASVIEAAVSPQTSSDGYFFSENVREFSTLESSQTSFVGNSPLDPGTYYVHVGGYDASCLACPVREFSAIQQVVVPAETSAPPPGSPDPASEPRAALHTLSVSRTKRYIRTALRRRFGHVYRHGYAKRIASCKRRSRTRISCRRVSWVIGDLSYKGRATIWLTFDDGYEMWNYAYTIRRTNEYCVVTGGRHCRRTYRVR